MSDSKTGSVVFLKKRIQELSTLCGAVGCGVCSIASAIVAPRTVEFSKRGAGNVSSIIFHRMISVNCGRFLVLLAENAESVPALRFIDGKIAIFLEPLVIR